MRWQAKRCRPLKLENARVLIVAPHPDDEAIGCGGLTARMVGSGCMPHVAILSGGGKSHAGCCTLNEAEIVAQRRQLTTKAACCLGLGDNHVHHLNFTDGSINGESTEVQHLKELLDELQPKTVFIPHWGEGWPDHLKAAEMMKTIVAPDCEIYEYCVWAWYYNVWRLNWQQARVLWMSDEEHHQKLQAVAAYITPLAPCGKPWSGVLPKLLLKAAKWNGEIFFKTR